MAISEKGLASALVSAKSLMGPSGDARIDNASRNVKSNGKSIDEINMMYENAGNDAYNKYEMDSMGYSKENIIKSNLPKEILESMSTQYIDTSSMNPDASILDRVMPDLKKKPMPQKKSAISVNENSFQNGGIDYTIVKAIVEEVIDRKLKELTKNVLNESKLNGISIQNGKIKLIDNSGNIFQGDLEYKGKRKK